MKYVSASSKFSIETLKEGKKTVKNEIKEFENREDSAILALSELLNKAGNKLF